jgi:hypothetical protein
LFKYKKGLWITYRTVTVCHHQYLLPQFFVLDFTALFFLLGLGLFFSFLILYAAGRTPWTGDQLVARPCNTIRENNKSSNMSVDH